MKSVSEDCVMSSKLTLQQVFEVSDLLCLPSERGEGWVLLYANAKGREAVGKLFDVNIRWTPRKLGQTIEHPDDWRSFEINIPATVDRLPSERVHLRTDFMPKDMLIEDAVLDQLSFILCANAYDHGARAAMWHTDKRQFNIFRPNSALQ